MASSEGDAREHFEAALTAFSYMPTEAKQRVLEKFTRLHYPSVKDRFHEAVYQVVCEIAPERRAYDPLAGS